MSATVIATKGDDPKSAKVNAMSAPRLDSALVNAIIWLWN